MIGTLNWVHLAWPMMAAACLTLGFIYFGSWLRRRERWDYFMFAGTALSVAVVGLLEISLMTASAVDPARAILRWINVATLLLALFLAGFAHYHFGKVRPWLLAVVVVTRTAVVALAFLLPEGVVFDRIFGLREILLPGGARISVIHGDVSPWSYLSSGSWLFLIALIADSAREAWSRSPPASRARISRLAGVILAFLFLSPLHVQLVRLGVIQGPYLVTPIFGLVILAIAIDLTSDIVRTSQLADELRRSETHLMKSERDRELALTELRLAEERFRGIAESAPSALIIVDAKGRITFGNRVASTVLGYSREELQGLELEKLLPEGLRARHRDHRDTFMRRPSVRPMGAGLDLKARRKNGTVFPIDVSLAPLPGGSGDEVVAVFWDNTRRREQELSAARLRDELSHLSRVAVLGELSASIAHEINQPLAAILSNAETAQRHLAKEPVNFVELRAIVADIVNDDRRAGEVIRRLRGMLRKEELPHLPLDLNEVLCGVLEIMHSDTINRGVVVATDFAADLPPVRGDSVQLQQVLLNLIVNGCDSMAGQDRAKRLTVRTRSENGELWAEIRDEGTGIPEEDLQRIFEPFVTNKAQGTGLGLSVCRTIVNAHGGRIWARNNAGGGATLTIALPVAEPAEG